MRLAFVHGINNEKNTPDSIREAWWTAIEEGWHDLGLTPKTRPEIDVGYYGKVLADAVSGRKPDAVAQGGTAESHAAALEFLRTYQKAANISDEELARALEETTGRPPEVVEQGRLMEFLVDVAATLEKIVPDKGRFLADAFLMQAGHYVDDAGLAAQIDLIVRKAIFDGRDDPLILISHSLGTVVAYRLLAAQRQAERDVHLFMTLGSPLSVAMMKDILPPRATFPRPPIEKWVNGFREDDFVTLGRPVSSTSLGFEGVENIHEGLVEEPNKHSIAAYLRSGPICARIHQGLP